MENKKMVYSNQTRILVHKNTVTTVTAFTFHGHRLLNYTVHEPSILNTLYLLLTEAKTTLLKTFT